MRKLILTLLGLCIATAASPAAICAQTSAGYVLDIDGSWILNGSNTLSHGEKLPAGGSIRLTSSPRYGRIVIADLRGEVLISRNCSVDNCSRAFSLPHPPPAASVLDTAFGILMKMISTAPRRYSAHRSRSVGLCDGVLKLSGEGVNFGSVLNIQGDQYLRWRSITEDISDSGPWSQPIKIVNSKFVMTPGLTPGLYTFEVMRQTGGSFESTSTAWILISDDSNHESMRSSFQEAKNLTEKWGSNVKSQTVRLYLQAKLDELARKQ